MFESEEQFEYRQRELEDNLEMSDRFFARYFSLLDRFADLPACDELIMSQLEKEFPRDFIDSLERYDEHQPPDEIDELDEAGLKEADPWEEQEGKELPPEMRMLRQLELRGRKIGWTFYQCVMDWSNIQIVLLSTSLGKLALRVMFYLGRSLGGFNLGMDSLASHETGSGIVFFKRVQSYCNQGNAIILELSKQAPVDMREVLLNRMQQIDNLHKELENQVEDCRELLRLEGGGI
ncbi:MAG: hypothetical protein PHG44_00865 [Lentisphaeria bacterium]|nr:hypothetical protein [Lentisphaeria bacterium]MDY0177452.1 hypothetical protein [Lentisphaeria bacterium]NLZ60076.1 hypothetical protein [Lentisphaerota bacterium]